MNRTQEAALRGTGANLRSGVDDFQITKEYESLEG